MSYLQDTKLGGCLLPAAKSRLHKVHPTSGFCRQIDELRETTIESGPLVEMVLLMIQMVGDDMAKFPQRVGSTITLWLHLNAACWSLMALTLDKSTSTPLLAGATVRNCLDRLEGTEDCITEQRCEQMLAAHTSYGNLSASSTTRHIDPSGYLELFCSSPDQAITSCKQAMVGWLLTKTSVNYAELCDLANCDKPPPSIRKNAHESVIKYLEAAITMGVMGQEAVRNAQLFNLTTRETVFPVRGASNLEMVKAHSLFGSLSAEVKNRGTQESNAIDSFEQAIKARRCGDSRDSPDPQAPLATSKSVVARQEPQPWPVERIEDKVPAKPLVQNDNQEFSEPYSKKLTPEQIKEVFKKVEAERKDKLKALSAQGQERVTTTKIVPSIPVPREKNPKAPQGEKLENTQAGDQLAALFASNDTQGIRNALEGMILSHLMCNGAQDVHEITRLMKGNMCKKGVINSCLYEMQKKGILKQSPPVGGGMSPVWEVQD